MRPVVGLEAVAHDACPTSVGEAATARDTRALSSLLSRGERAANEIGIQFYDVAFQIVFLLAIDLIPLNMCMDIACVPVIRVK